MNPTDNRLHHALVVGVVLFSAVCDADAQITFNFDFQVGSGFNDLDADASTPLADIQTRRDTLNAVATYLNSVLDENGDIDIEVRPDTLGATALAEAGPFASTASGFTNGAAFIHATTGIDPFSTVPDGTLTVNFDANYNEDLGAPTGAEFDLFSVLLHELTHALGFISFLEADGTSGLDSPNVPNDGGNPGAFSVYDSLIADESGDPVFAAGGNFVGDLSDLTGTSDFDSDLFFIGTNAVAANGGNPVPLFTPAAFDPGSSVGHVNENLAGFGAAVLGPTFAPGEVARTFLPVELAILQDIGYTLAPTVPVPEPGSLVLMALALASATPRVRR